MKVIKIKVKNILLIIFMLFITIPYLLYFIGEIGYSSSIYIKETHLSTYTVGALKIYDKWPTIKFNKGRLKYVLAMSNYNYNKEVIGSYTNGGYTFLHKTGNMEQALIAKQYFEEGVALGENNNYYKKNLNALINLEMTLGNNEVALKLIKNAKESEEDEIKTVAMLNEVVYYVKVGEYDKALEICNNNKDNVPHLYNYINTISYMTGDFKLLNENRSKLYELNEYGYVVNRNLTYNTILDGEILKDINFVDNIDIYNESNNEVIINESSYEWLKFGKISGKVISNGVKVANTKVSLTRGYISMSSNDGFVDNIHISTEDLYKEQFVYTNSNGEFVFNNARSDMLYTIAVFLPSIYGEKVVMKESEDQFKVKENENLNIDIIFNPIVNIKNIEEDKEKDELVVNYEKVKEATKYGLQIVNEAVGVNTGPITDGDVIRIPLTNGAMQSFNIYTGAEKDEELGIDVSSKSLLGFVNGEKIYVKVIAYDDNGKIVSRTNLWGNEIKLKKKSLNEGEKLILDGKEKEGFNWINNKLLEDPMNKEYIYPIIRLAIEKKDYDLARELMNRLEEINKTGFDKAYFESLIDSKEQRYELETE